MTSTSAALQKHPPIQQIVNIIALAAVIVVNALANILPLNGITTGAVSDRFPSLFTPAGYVFSIWGLIYLLLVAFVVYQALPAQRGSERLGRLGYLFAWSCMFNVAWLFSWHYGLIWLSQLLMLGLLATLIGSYQRLQVNRAGRGLGWWLVDLPFSVYLGWITVATVANTSIFLLDLGWNGAGWAPALTVLVIAVAAFIGLMALRLRGDLAFALVLAWAFTGIGVKQYGLTEAVAIAAFIAAAVMLAAVVWQARTAPAVGRNALR